jgi:hypothetical protein
VSRSSGFDLLAMMPRFLPRSVQPHDEEPCDLRAGMNCQSPVGVGSCPIVAWSNGFIGFGVGVIAGPISGHPIAAEMLRRDSNDDRIVPLRRVASRRATRPTS